MSCWEGVSKYLQVPVHLPFFKKKKGGGATIAEFSYNKCDFKFEKYGDIRTIKLQIKIYNVASGPQNKLLYSQFLSCMLTTANFSQSIPLWGVWITALYLVLPYTCTVIQLDL